MTPPQPTRVLFVCLGNICRSPAAEGVFLHQLALEQLQDHFLVDSAGTGGWHRGHPPDERMQAAAAQRGIQLTSRARQIQLADISSFDHILTMDEDNLTQVRALSQRVQSGSQRARITPLTRFCRQRKAAAVPDPYYGGPEGFEQVLDLLEDACAGLLEALRPR
ncbi:low molecular weight protein-tyrosine-phosphatase [Cyanobium sp. LEGE 06113]|uniref:low molecular weight protein-tyrosine-phosphatase n=1 Tax=Cyanobium sp. LEGE 06113 TaxID=1297573 RepID=UPI00187E12AA|nr:low molecular weight protein-tyrosine-phosphatase [Cyanobium sp. LEGE 06113]MBE9154606.1 low molecular weight phosphotyrosine protein phosphatase [Cyanobium sp. LEGE 06113]